jgi:hypothetical protein
VKLAFAIAVVTATSLAHAQPVAGDPAAALRDANAAAIAGDWQRVGELVDPLLLQALAPADTAEAHRLAGLAAFFAHRDADAESHFLAYLHLDLDARLDPALVPPEAVTFFEDVRARHAAELRALRPKPRAKRSLVLALLPPFGQIQGGEHTKAWIIGGALVGFAAANVASYALLRSWCSDTDLTCDTHTRAASAMRAINLASAGGFLAAYLYGVYDGVVEYRHQNVVLFANPTSGGGVAGVLGAF